MYFSFVLSQQEMLYFAIDNVDLKIDTLYDKNQLLWAVIMTYQNKTNKIIDLSIERNSKRESRQIKNLRKLITVSLQTVANTECKNYVSLSPTDKLNFILKIMQSRVYQNH